MKSIVKWTLWQRRWSTTWWSIGVFAMIFINMIFYPTFKDQAAELQKSFESLPESAIQLFGGSTDFFSPIGFLNSQIFFLTLPLILGVLAISLGSSLLAREEQDHTVESLLARPITRGQLLAGKGLAGTIILSIVTTVSLLTTVVTAAMVDLEVPAKNMLIVTAACYVLVLSLGAIAFVITALGKARVASFGIAGLLGFGGYIISSLAGTVTWLQGPSKIFPFHYYESEPLLRGTYNWTNLIILSVVVIVCSALSWFVFRKRDIY